VAVDFGPKQSGWLIIQLGNPSFEFYGVPGRREQLSDLGEREQLSELSDRWPQTYNRINQNLC
jgi:hypothetical protein